MENIKILEDKSQLKYGFICLTTDLKSGKFYIGQHKRSQNIDNPDDSYYFGSGLVISSIIKKNKKSDTERLSRIILEDCDSQEELNEREVYWINEYNSTDINIGYNLAIGGYFGCTEEIIEIRSESIRRNLRENPETIKKLSRAGIKRYEDPKEREKTSKTMKRVMGTPEMRKKQSDIGKIAQNTPEAIARKKETQSERFKNPEERLKQSQIQKISQNKPGVNEKRSKSLIESWVIDRETRIAAQNRPDVVEKKRIAMTGKMVGDKCTASVPVICIELNIRFTGISYAIKWLNKKGRGNNIYRALIDKDYTAGGYYWKYERENQLELFKNRTSNSEKMKGKLKGSKNGFAKGIICRETGISFQTLTEAGAYFKMDKTTISQLVKKEKPINGLMFEFIKKVNKSETTN